MKQIYLITLAFLLATSSFANKITAICSGNWAATATWSPNRLPQNNDTIVIPASMVILLLSNVSLNNVILKISGTLDMDGGALLFDNNSRVLVLTNGKILTEGNIEQVKIGTVVKLQANGNNISVSGPSFADKTTGTAPNGFVMNATLPVIFNSFYVSRTNNNIILDWSTSQEFNNNNFEIQRSTDGSNWTVIAIVMGVGTSNAVNKYNYTDKNMTSKVAYYRIRQVDIDGRSEYSTVKSIHSNGVSEVAKIYAAAKNINIEFNSEVKNNVTVRVFNTNGQIIAQQNYQGSTYKITMNSANVNSGIYVVQVTDGKGWEEAAKIIL